MNISPKDAAKVLGIVGKITPEIVKKAYRVASMKYHPDRGGSVEMMQAVNAAYAVLKDLEEDFTAESSNDDNYGEELNAALLKVISLEGIEIEICGAWVWITGNTKPHSKALGKNGAGFFFASKKKAWYYRPKEWKSVSRGNWSMDKIRQMHGSQSVETKVRTKIAS